MSVSTFVTNETQIDSSYTEPISHEPHIQVDDTCLFSNVNWAKEQSADKVLIRELLLSELFLSGSALKSESSEVCKYLREAIVITKWNALLNNTPVKPVSFSKTAFRLLQTNLGHHGRDQTLHLM